MSYWSAREVADAIRILEHAAAAGTGTIPAAAALGLSHTGAEGLAVRAATDSRVMSFPGSARRRKGAELLRSGWQPAV